MIELHLEPHDSAMLRTPSQPFDFQNTPYDAPELAFAMAKFMVDYGGYGLSAPQVGVPYRVIALRSTPNYVLFNPKIIDLSGGEVEAVEGCLTFPGIGVTIKRHKVVRLRFQMPSGETDTKVFHGLSARVVQHEVDHIDGVLMFDRAGKVSKQFALKKWAKTVKEGRHVPRPLTVAEKAIAQDGISSAMRRMDQRAAELERAQ